MPHPLPPDQLTEDQRTQEVAAIFAKGILRLRHAPNRLAFSAEKPLTGEQEKETDRQSAANTLPALTTTHP